MSWTVITVSYNSSEALRTFWTGGVPSGVRWLVVDNQSSDGSAALARSLGADVIELDANVGFSAANNRGLSEATSRFVAFVNPDIAVDWASLEILAQDILENDALVAPQLVNADGSIQRNGRGLPYLFDKFAHRGVMLPGHRLDHYLPSTADDLTPVAWVMGAAVCGLRSQLTHLGGWDAGYFIYYEDHEIGLRAWAHGVPVLVDSRARWTHGWARATAGADRTAWRYELRSALRFYRRYPELILPIRRLAMHSAYCRHLVKWRAP